MEQEIIEVHRAFEEAKSSGKLTEFIKQTSGVVFGKHSVISEETPKLPTPEVQNIPKPESPRTDGDPGLMSHHEESVTTTEDQVMPEGLVSEAPDVTPSTCETVGDVPAVSTPPPPPVPLGQLIAEGSIEDDVPDTRYVL